MSMRPSAIEPVPEETARIARAAFCKGNLLMRIRDEIGVLYDDQMFTSLYDARGQLAIAPWRLALVTVFQFLENLSDRQAAEAVRGRIDLKYALSLDLEDAGFDFSVLCEFRARLLAGEHDQNLLEVMLEHLGERGLVKARGKQRTDSTHVLAAIRSLNHLELVGETMRAALNAVATSAPQWLIEHNRPAWAERYGARVGQYRLPAVERLRIIWIQQFYHDQGRVRWRRPVDQPPVNQRLHSPYDPDARYAKKRDTSWIGYKVHLTETCEADRPNLVTDVQTTAAGTPDGAATAPVQSALAGRGLLPEAHVVDAGYVDAALLVASQVDHAIDLLGPVALDHGWRARSEQGFDLSAFTIVWPDRVARCPAARPAGIGRKPATSGALPWSTSRLL